MINSHQHHSPSIVPEKTQSNSNLISSSDPNLSKSTHCSSRSSTPTLLSPHPSEPNYQLTGCSQQIDGSLTLDLASSSPDTDTDPEKPHGLALIDSDLSLTTNNLTSEIPRTEKQHYLERNQFYMQKDIDRLSEEKEGNIDISNQEGKNKGEKNHQLHYKSEHFGNSQYLEHNSNSTMSSTSTTPIEDDAFSHLKKTPISRGALADNSVFESMSLISPAFTPVPSDFSPAASLYGSQLDLAEAANKAAAAASSANLSSSGLGISSDRNVEISGKSAVPNDFLNEDLNDKLKAIALDDENKPHKAPHVRNPSAAGLVERSLDQTLPKVFCESRARIPTTSGTEIFLHLYRNNIDDKEHLAIVFGQDIHSKTLFEPRPGETEQDRMTRGAYVGKLYPGRQRSDEVELKQSPLPSVENACSTKKTKDTLARIHSECYTGETAWSARCDCGEQLDEAARLMAKEGCGVIVYLRQEGRGIGLGEKLKAYNLQDLGADTVTANLMLRHPADARSFSLATAILLDLGLNHIRLLTNNPDKIVAVEGKHKQITVTQRVPMIPLSWQNKGGFKSAEVDKYLQTKVQRMGHLLNLSGV